MAASFNNCTFSGNVARDPECRYFENGNMVANFTIAVSGRNDEETLWLPVAVWGKRAQTIADYVKKGSKLIVTGELREEKWTKDGEEKKKISLSCQNFVFIDSAKKGEKGGGGESRATQRNTKPQGRPIPEPEDEEVPF